MTRKDPIVQGRSEGEQDLADGFAPAVLQYRDVWPSTKAVRWRATGGLASAHAQPSADGVTVAVEFENLVTPPPPEGAPPRYKDVGHLEFTDFKDWSEVSALLAPLYQKAATLQPDSPLRAEIAKIKAASADPEVEASLALRLVQDQVRYEFVGMDNGGYNPAPADLTWARRFGDCKGKTVLLLAILNELGIQAEPVMVNTQWGDALGDRLPKLDVFDHVLVRALINGRAFWLDGTAAADREVRDLAQPAYGWGLPVRASGATLERMAGEPLVLPKGETIMTIDSSAGLDEPPPVTVETVLHGDVAVLFSRKVGAISHDEAQKGFTNAWAKNYAWVDVKSVDWSFDAAAGEFRFSMKGVGKPGAWGVDNQSGAQVFEIDSSAFSKPKALARAAGPNADAPFAVDFPGYERAVTVVKLPDGGEGFSLVGDNVDETINGVQYRRATRFEHGAVVMTRSIRSMTNEVSAAQAKADDQKLAAFDTASSWIRGPLAPGKQGQDVQSLVSRGFDLLSQERPDMAMALFDQALAGDPTLTRRPRGPRHRLRRQGRLGQRPARVRAGRADEHRPPALDRTRRGAVRRRTLRPGDPGLQRGAGARPQPGPLPRPRRGLRRPGPARPRDAGRRGRHPPRPRRPRGLQPARRPEPGRSTSRPRRWRTTTAPSSSPPTTPTTWSAAASPTPR